jgi:hypothetical protein
MVKEVLIIRASISSILLRNALFQGLTLGGMGILILVSAGIFMPVNSLHQWGWVLFLISFGLIAWGLIPYRHLACLQLKPYELTLTEDNLLAFYSKGKKILTLPLESIVQISYISHSKNYGVAIWLKPNPTSPVIIYQSPKEVEKLRYKGWQIGQADLFFPYFNQRAYDELIDWQHGACLN